MAMAQRSLELPVTIDASPISRQQLRLQGVVQGVGFRPFVYALAKRYDLNGFVFNDSAGVGIEVEGDPASLAEFRCALSQEKPPLAQIDEITVTSLPVTGTEGFAIIESESHEDSQLSQAHTLISPDISICDECLAELFDPNDRRYRYPFINCTNCGPRFTIIEDVPYDRPLTTMAAFALCPDCRREYTSPDNLAHPHSIRLIDFNDFARNPETHTLISLPFSLSGSSPLLENPTLTLPSLVRELSRDGQIEFSSAHKLAEKKYPARRDHCPLPKLGRVREILC